MIPRTLAIFGPGLLGGSVALAVRRSMPGTRIQLWARRAEAVQQLQRFGSDLADLASTDAASVARGADLVILAVPVPVMEQTLRAALPGIAAHTIVTDVGSVKQSVVAALEPMVACFVGSHPMAGSHRLGFEEARATLFEGATCIVTPTANTQRSALEAVISFWQRLGAQTLQLDPATHDHHVARVSHLPHATAFALVQAALSAAPQAASCVGQGFRDSTRIAGSDPELWSGIFLENRREVTASLRDQLVRTKELLDLIEANDKESLRAWLAEAQRLRQLVSDTPATHGSNQSPQA